MFQETHLTFGERVLQIVAILIYLVTVALGYTDMTIGIGNALDWVYHHETLTTGLAAVASAIVGAWFLHRQTNQLARQEADRLAREREAARAVLPLTLAGISQYSLDAAKATKHLLDQCVGEILPNRTKLTLPQLPELPDEKISALQQMIEALPLAEISPLANLIADIQIQYSRLSGAIAEAGSPDKLVTKTNLENYIIDCAMIYARVSRLFPFARRTAHAMPDGIIWRDVVGALNFFDMPDPGYDRIRATMKRVCNNNWDSKVDFRWER